MESKLDVLRGKIILHASKMHDYMQLVFEEGIGLNVYNDFCIQPGDEKKLQTLKQKKLLSVQEMPTEIVLLLSDGLQLVIDMRDSAYNGPEALELTRQGEPTIVWN